MKRLEVTARVDPEAAPPLFDALANAPAVEEARILGVNTNQEGTETLLVAIDGDPSPLVEEGPETTGVEWIECSETVDDRTYALVVLRPLETPLFGEMHRASTGEGIVMLTPFVYRDGHMYGQVVGAAEPMQRAYDRAPDGMDVHVDELTELRGEIDAPETSLSERQREAVETAIALGYYEQPRGATHEDVAAELDCAPATASDHLQKAEAKVIRAVMGEHGRRL